MRRNFGGSHKVKRLGGERTNDGINELCRLRENE